ncbi:hypothetical protein E2C01_052393 [Portunus trituberculatus]|uniref:Uncharacterized protein n=1 Tax=Portunus trituberculatus TaxID=210409 RepID=A0A5B7GLF8_PORTR|nr:hypothetical protein [Portunus trituberculatus]
MQEREGVREIMTTNHSNISATCPGEWPASQAVTNPDGGHIASPRAPFKVTPVPVTFLETLPCCRSVATNPGLSNTDRSPPPDFENDENGWQVTGTLTHKGGMSPEWTRTRLCNCFTKAPRGTADRGHPTLKQLGRTFRQFVQVFREFPREGTKGRRRTLVPRRRKRRKRKVARGARVPGPDFTGDDVTGTTFG